jgi:acyl-CoA synthetase (AMP-forming)/AMP-acid ligase II
MTDREGSLVGWDTRQESNLLIEVKGYQAAPAEIEALLLTHPRIADAAVIPIKDDECGVPKARLKDQIARPACLPAPCSGEPTVANGRSQGCCPIPRNRFTAEGRLSWAPQAQPPPGV